METYSILIPKLPKLSNFHTITDITMQSLFQRSEMQNEFRFSLLKSFKFGIINISIDYIALRSGIFRLKEIECILSNGSLYYHKASSSCNYSLNLNLLDKIESNASYIYIVVDKYNRNSELPSQNIIKENLSSELNIYTVNESVSFIVSKELPKNIAYLPIAKLKLTKFGLELDDYLPPMLNLKTNIKIIEKLENILNLMNTKLLIVKNDFENNYKNNNSFEYHENSTKISNIQNAIYLIEKAINQEIITPTELYLIMKKILVYVVSLNYTTELPNVDPYNHFDFGIQFNYIVEKITEIINYEISEKYKLLHFAKKEDFYFLKLPSQDSLHYKLALKKPYNITQSQIIDWMNMSLICEKNEYHAMIEKRSLGYDRNSDYADIETNLDNEYVFFNITLPISHKNNDNTLIISQSNSKFNLFQPDEIALYIAMY